MSLPLRECGLKLCQFQPFPHQLLSLPLRECGLKPSPTLCLRLWCLVTPPAGVWIETNLENLRTLCSDCNFGKEIKLKSKCQQSTCTAFHR